MDDITPYGQQTVLLLIRRLWFESLVGVHEPPENDLERFLSMIRFNTRGKLDDLPDIQFNS